MLRSCPLLTRFFSQSKWESYKQIELQKSEYETNFMRSSGPGGQSVNKTNSKAELRLRLKQCGVVDENIMTNLQAKYGNQINKDHQLIVRCQTFKSQSQNLKECFIKTQKMLFFCSQVKEERNDEPYEESGEVRERRLAEKKRRSVVKKTRQGKHLDY